MVLVGCLEVEFAFSVHLSQDFVCSKNVHKARFQNHHCIVIILRTVSLKNIHWDQNHSVKTLLRRHRIWNLCYDKRMTLILQKCNKKIGFKRLFRMNWMTIMRRSCSYIVLEAPSLRMTSASQREKCWQSPKNAGTGGGYCSNTPGQCPITLIGHSYQLSDGRGKMKKGLVEMLWTRMKSNNTDNFKYVDATYVHISNAILVESQKLVTVHSRWFFLLTEKDPDLFFPRRVSLHGPM